ncbi:sodium/proline symporter PutP [Halioxenophilus aromaticivorans]|uniref:Sodium/proline symporter n=1 Tax=Halioxenophilus aromaticivorans TaxID=1306992 RepID=A0AAV3U1W8_9ALTE
MSADSMAQFDVGIVVTFALYLAGMFAIGFWAWRKTTDTADYFLGGRSLSAWPAALSAGASDMSGWLLLGLPGYAYLAGMEAIWIGVGLLLGTWLNWLLLADRFRTATEHYGNALTIPEYLSNRFDDHKRILQMVAAVFIVLFFLIYTSAGLVAGGKLFNTVFGAPSHWAVLIGCLCIVSYTFFGGFLAVAWTDLVQALLMAAALLVVPIMAWQGLTGSGSLAGMDAYRLNPFTQADGQPLGATVLVSSLAWGLGYFGQPHILARFAAISSVGEVPKARRVAVTWCALTMACALAVGMLGYSYAQRHGLNIADSETVFMVLVNVLFHPWIAGILLAAILAAIMSTADSQLLVCSSALAEDFYKTLFKRSATPARVLWVSRLAVAAVAVIATLLALMPGNSVLDLVSYAWAGFGAAFGPIILLSVYWQKMTCWGALAGMLVGALTVVVWKNLTGGVFEVYELFPGFILAAAATIVVSKLKRPTA